MKQLTFESRKIVVSLQLFFNKSNSVLVMGQTLICASSALRFQRGGCGGTCRQAALPPRGRIRP